MTQPPVVVIGAGQSGLAGARAARDAGLRPIVLEAGARAAGSWPRYYESLRLFSPVRFSAFPDTPFPGEPDAYPTRDDVAAYLESYAAGLDVEIRTNTAVEAVESADDNFLVRTRDGDEIAAAGVIAASGSFGNPYLPTLSGQRGFTGQLLHVADYRRPEPYAGKRVIVVGAGNSAIQVGYELSRVARTTIASRQPIDFWEQQLDGKDVHYRLVGDGFDDLPPHWLAQLISGRFVLDTGRYREALEAGQYDRRPMFTGFEGDRVVWSDGSREAVDVVLFATGYRPHLDYLHPLGALDETGMPLHVGGISTSHLGLVYLGLEFQRSFASNTLRGVHRDAQHVVAPLAAHVGKAAARVAEHGLPTQLPAA